MIWTCHQFSGIWRPKLVKLKTPNRPPSHKIMFSYSVALFFTAH